LPLPVRISVKTSIPAKSSGRLLDALTDLIRPITESRGLKADMIRLQREEVSIKIVQLSKKRIEAERGVITPIPLKSLVPLLEQSSLEDPEDKTMISLWANLLSSAAMGAQHNVPRYVSILSQINGKQARIIQKIFVKKKRKIQKINADLLADDLWAIDQAGILLRLRQEAPVIKMDRMLSILIEHIDIAGVAVNDVIFNRGQEQWDGVTKNRKRPLLEDEDIIDIETLESLNLIKDISFKYMPFEDYEISVFFYRVTPLCIEMFSACNPDLFIKR